jgi:ABC-type branched-subunit amino acid transport system substrate-binding protein
VAWDYVNRHGGVNGRQIKLNIYDTTSTTTGAKTAAQKAVEDDKAFVIVMLDRLEIQDAVAQYLQTKSFPNIEVQLPANPPASEDWTFGLNIDHGRQGALAADYLVKTMHLKRLGICTEQQIQLAPGRSSFIKEATALGASVVYNDQIDGQGNDFSGNVLKAQQSKAQAVWLYMAPTPAVKYVNEAQSVAFHPTWFANSISWAFNLTLTGGAAWQGAKAFSEWPTLDDPRTATYKQAYAAYDQRTGSTNQPDDLGVAAWGYTEIVAEGLREAGRNLGQLAFKRAMTNLHYEAADRMWAPLAFSPGVRIGTNQVDVYRVGMNNGQPAWQLEHDYTSSF